MSFIKDKIAAIVAALLIAFAGWAGHSLGSANGYSRAIAAQAPTIAMLQDDVNTHKLREAAWVRTEEKNRTDWQAQVAAVKAEKTRIEKDRDAKVENLRARIEYLAAHRVLIDPGAGTPASGSGRDNGKSPEAAANGGAVGTDSRELSAATSQFLWRFAGEAERVRLDLLAQVEYAKRLETELKACLRE